jgi:hypothetical protein
MKDEKTLMKTLLFSMIIQILANISWGFVCIFLPDYNIDLEEMIFFTMSTCISLYFLYREIKAPKKESPNDIEIAESNSQEVEQKQIENEEKSWKCSLCFAVCLFVAILVVIFIVIFVSLQQMIVTGHWVVYRPNGNVMNPAGGMQLATTSDGPEMIAGYKEAQFAIILRANPKTSDSELGQTLSYSQKHGMSCGGASLMTAFDDLAALPKCVPTNEKSDDEICKEDDRDKYYEIVENIIYSCTSGREKEINFKKMSWGSGPSYPDKVVSCARSNTLFTGKIEIIYKPRLRTWVLLKIKYPEVFYAKVPHVARNRKDVLIPKKISKRDRIMRLVY